LHVVLRVGSGVYAPWFAGTLLTEVVHARETQILSRSHPTLEVVFGVFGLRVWWRHGVVGHGRVVGELWLLLSGVGLVVLLQLGLCSAVRRIEAWSGIGIAIRCGDEGRRGGGLVGRLLEGSSVRVRSVTVFWPLILDRRASSVDSSPGTVRPLGSGLYTLHWLSVDAASWSAYEEGVFDGCNQTNPDLDHAVQLVGFGTDSQFGDYWLVRNSWAPLWGENGYIRLRRTPVERCGVDVTPSHGDGCRGGPPTEYVCGTCGVVYDALYPNII